jgi:type IV secretory pathway VirB2 component (pilin)
MNPLAVFLLAGPLIAFVTVINFAEWSLSDIARRADARRGDRRGLRADWFRRVDRAAVFNTRNWTPRRRDVQSQGEVLEMRKFKRTTGSLGRRTARLGYAFGVLTIALPARVFATTAGGVLPWDQPLNTLQNDLQGTVAHAIVTAAIIGTGITWSVSEHGTGVRKMSAVAFGGAAALGATQLMTTLFPLGAALF